MFKTNDPSSEIMQIIYSIVKCEDDLHGLSDKVELKLNRTLNDQEKHDIGMWAYFEKDNYQMIAMGR